MRAHTSTTWGVIFFSVLKEPKVTCPAARAGNGATGGAPSSA